MLKPEIARLEHHLRALVGERNPLTSLDQLHRCGRYIEASLQDSGLRMEREEVPFNGTLSHNILGFKAGSDPSRGTFVLAAHYDSVQGTPGADDNASAVAALLETARCLEPVRLGATLLFASFTLEEYGFVGCRHFLAGAHRRKDRFRGMVSMEMIGFRNGEPGSQSFPPYVDASRYPDRGNFLAAVGNEPSRALTESLAQGMQTAHPRLPVHTLIVPGRGDAFTEVRLSDHSPFWEVGVPAVMLTDTAFFRNPHYHQPTDTLETLDLEFLQDGTRAMAGFLERHLT